MSKSNTRNLATAGIIAALYAAMAYFSSVFGITYGPVQCHFSEALCVLPFLTPAAVPGFPGWAGEPEAFRRSPA